MLAVAMAQGDVMHDFYFLLSGRRDMRSAAGRIGARVWHVGDGEARAHPEH